MIVYYLTLSFSLLLIVINADTNETQHPAINIAVNKHEVNLDSDDQSWKTTPEETLIRVIRSNVDTKEYKANNRQRRQIIDDDEIWGMAKKVAITVIVVVSLCIICCVITTVFICVKCCCNGNNNRKRNQNPAVIQVPQPIFVHTGSVNYQQQVPPSTWTSENRPMLPQPSAPPRSDDDFHMELPPPYEKICSNR